MAQLLLVPEVASGATDVVVAEWLVQAGSAVTAGQPIAVVETDKAVVEVEAEADGVVLAILASAGKTIPVGSPMTLLGSHEEIGLDANELLAELVHGHDEGSPTRHDGSLRTAARESPAPRGGSDASETPTTPDATGSGRVFASPLARRLVREAGLDLSEITGTGPRGRIRRRDVESALEQRRATVAAGTELVSPARDDAPELVPHSKARRAIARILSDSKQTVPHFYLKRRVCVDELLDLRRRVNSSRDERVSLNDLVVRAVAVAHSRVPEVNVSWSGEGMLRYRSIDISIAIASKRGLVTPVLRRVDTLNLTEVSRQISGFVAKADDGKLRQGDLEGASVTVSNLGMFGIDEFAAIINPPQSMILAVGAVRRVPTAVEVGDAWVVETRAVMDLVLSADHRAIDGALGAEWMAALAALIEDPISLLV